MDELYGEFIGYEDFTVIILGIRTVVQAMLEASW